MKNRKISFFLLVCIVQVVVVLVMYKSIEHNDILRIECGKEKLFFSYISEDKLFKDGDNIKINSYQDEETKEYFLFFPNSFRNRKSIIKLFSAEQILVNEKIYFTNNACYFLAEGKNFITVSNKTYVLNVMFGAKIPSIFIDLSTGNLQYVQESKENIDYGHINIYDEEGAIQYKNDLLDIHGRGNSSWEYQLMKGYSITIGSKAPLVSDRISDKWNLIGNGYDPSLIENAMMYGLADNVGLEYSPQIQHVDLYMSGEYVGVYLLSTKIKISESSINIENLEKKTQAVNALPLNEYKKYGLVEGENGKSKGIQITKNPLDITGGYLLEQDHADRFANEICGFVTERAANFVIKSPENASKEQAEYIRTFVQEIEDAMNQEDGRNPVTKKHYEEYLDVESFVKSYLLQEISKNMDMNLTSQFFYKEPGNDTLLYSGPVWDFDYTFGMADVVVGGTNLSSPKDLLIECYNVEGPSAFSFACLYRHQDFKENVKRIYKEEFREKLQELLDSGIANYVNSIRKSAMMNQARWGIEKDYDVQIKEIKDFMAARVDFLDEVWEIEK